MKHITALVIKFVIITVVSEIILGIFTNLSIGEILLVSLTITVITYIIGDLLILSVFNNTVAAVGDAGLCWLIIYLSNYVWPIRSVSLLSALSAAVIIGIGEIFLHMYIEENILHQTPKDRDASIIR
ncbi:MAG TPA: DUF2512 family protein [Anaerovoracaceae bacterium]|nr:DUF2512 family protein [Anaerovoracaceae bacterium]